MKISSFIASIFIFVSLGACTSSKTPLGMWNYSRAQDLAAAGEFEKAIRHSSEVLLMNGNFVSQDHSQLHFLMLEKMNRKPANDAIQEFFSRFDRGEDTSQEPSSISKAECEGEGFRPGEKPIPKLIRKYHRSRSNALREIDSYRGVVATFEIDSNGIRNIRILRAVNPAVAWLVIESIDLASLNEKALKRLDPSVFPVPYCTWQSPPRLKSSHGIRW